MAGGKPAPWRLEANPVKWKIGLSIIGLLVLATAVLTVGPRLINWNDFKPQLAELVYEETGKELTIDGDIELNLVPSLTFRTTGIRLVEPTFQTKTPLAAIAEISGEISLFSLLFGELDVQSFVISKPEFNLVVSEEGDTNWRLYVSRPAKDDEDGDASSGLLPVAIATLDNVRIEQGRVQFHDRRTGQDIVAEDLKTGVSLPNRAAALLIEGGTTLNKKAVSWTFDVSTLAELEDGREAKVTGTVKSGLLALTTALNLDLAPPFDLTGELTANATSVGAIASWLDRPLEEDPGAVRIKATFKSEEDQKTALTAVLEGKDLNATLSGDLDLGAKIPTANLKLEGKVLDFSRYFPAPADTKLAPSAPREDSQINLATAGRKFRQPLDLGFLTDINAKFSLQLEKIITHRITMGPILANGAIKEGSLSAKLQQLSLYGGTLSGDVSLRDKNGNAALTADAQMAKIPFDKIGEGLALDSLPISGTGTGSLSFTSDGPTIQQLAQNARFDLNLTLTPIADTSKDAMISAAKINLTRKETRGPGQLDGTMTFKGQPVTLTGNVTPKRTANDLTGMDFTTRLQSKLATLKIEGTRDLSPTPKTEAHVDFKAGSARKLALWLDLPAAKAIKETGTDPITVTGTLHHQDQVTTFEKLTFSGPLISAIATGKIDEGAEPPAIELDIDGKGIDVDRLLALLPQAPEKSQLSAEQAQEEDAFVAFLSDKALELSGLQSFDMDLKLHLDKALYEEVEFGPITTNTLLKQGKLATSIKAFQYDGSDLTAQMTFDTKPSVYDFTARFNIARWKGETVARTRKGKITLEQGITGQGDFSARGRSPRALVASLRGKLHLSVPGISFSGGKIAGFSQTSLDLIIPETPNTLELKAKSTLILGKEKIELPLVTDLKTGRLISLVQDSDMPIDLTVSLGESNMSLVGKISNARTTPKANLEMSFQAPSLTAYRMLIQDLPDVAPVNAKATLVADRENIHLSGLAARVGPSDLAGQLTVSLADDPRDIQGTLTSNLIDLSIFQPEPKEAKTKSASSGETAPAAAGEDKYVFKDTPFPTEILAEYNANMIIDIKKLKVSNVMELDNVTANILLENKVLSLDPLRMEKGKGTLETSLIYNTAVEVPKLTLSSTIQDLDVVVTDDVRLILDSHSDLTASGNSPRKLASSLNGRTDWISRKGQIDSGFLGFLSFGAGNIFSTFFGDKKNAPFDCMVIRFNIENGLMTPAVAMVDTDDLVIAASGNINLRDETLALTIGTSARTVGVADLVVPILVTGTLKSPQAIPNPVAGTKNLSVGILSLLNPVNAVNTVFGTDILGGNKPPCALAFEKVADTKAPADLTLTAEQSKNKGLLGATAEEAGSLLKSVGSGLNKLFGGENE
ncbi:AsmA family protein [Sneathiella marina]|uniref:AsmA family protein n=1 Tax=Sneathiella marina TaxID=2950108 RepID=A0ABY4W6G3_9PROT|nr:AsmA family protein [Sneathiella marina]USG62765.1 AsmA family protein [Sneathiella marina]